MRLYIHSVCKNNNEELYFNAFPFENSYYLIHNRLRRGAYAYSTGNLSSRTSCDEVPTLTKDDPFVLHNKTLSKLAGIPVEWKSSVCLIRMKYRIIILIIIIISLGKILSSYIANTSRTHACTDVRTRTLAHTHTPRTTVAVRCVGAPNHDVVMVGLTLFDAGQTMADRRLIEINYARATLYAR